jgi:hypothetical protein
MTPVLRGLQRVFPHFQDSLELVGRGLELPTQVVNDAH